MARTFGESWYTCFLIDLVNESIILFVADDKIWFALDPADH